MPAFEHRTSESVMSAYKHFADSGRPNFAIYQGRDQRDSYEAGNPEDGAVHLQEWLEMIENNGTGAVYTIRVYPADATNISNKTPFTGSTTFMLNGNLPAIKNENGLMILDRGAAKEQYVGANAAVQLKMKELEEETRALRERVHKAELANLREEFNNKIAGLTNVQEKPDLMETIVTKLTEKPETIGQVFDGLGKFIGSLADLFNKRTPAPAPAEQEAEPSYLHQVAGTDQDEPLINLKDKIAEMKTKDFQPQDDPDHQEDDLDPDRQDDVDPQDDINAADDDVLTPEEQALADRQDVALDAVDNNLGMEITANVLEAIAVLSTKIDPVSLNNAMVKLANMPAIKIKSLMAMM